MALWENPKVTWSQMLPCSVWCCLQKVAIGDGCGSWTEGSGHLGRFGDWIMHQENYTGKVGRIFSVPHKTPAWHAWAKRLLCSPLGVLCGTCPSSLPIDILMSTGSLFSHLNDQHSEVWFNISLCWDLPPKVLKENVTSKRRTQLWRHWELLALEAGSGPVGEMGQDGAATGG